ncbi:MULTISPECIES: stage III sporulation protein AA [unclassified Virgibacillus]|uniref:stage III sporulation protein AA n=1 Tax=unclassified Virgibacillus TaxID=2620237 RepID=UPI0024DEF214|nr:stage III sporulation protein AA [Virgibacillus sp. LDC-1]
MEEILRLFPEPLMQEIRTRLDRRWDKLQEIRCRLQQPIEVIFDHHTEWIEACILKPKSMMYMINRLSEFSLYRLEDELREGYLTIEGGHRIGLAGKVNTRGGTVKAIQHIAFLNIRIAKEQIGIAQSIMPYVYGQAYWNTLIVGEPQTGKTTLIRDMARMISIGWDNIVGKKVAIIDERSEIAASINGVPQHNVGKRTDVLDACPKAEGMMMMIRSMSPEVLIVDEIGSDLDVKALMEAINAGVVIICTIHGRSLTELKKRPSLQPLFQQRVFQRILLLDRQTGPGQVKRIWNEEEENILQKSRCRPNEMDRSTSFNKYNYMGRA